VKSKHALQPIGDPLLLVSGRAIENCVRFASKCRPDVSGIGMGIAEAREIGLNAIQGFL
jgi:hypothetical protein